MKLFAAVDIGTTNVKCVISDSDMRVLSEATKEYRTISINSYMHEQDPEDWWNCTTETIRAALSKANLNGSDVIGICVSSQAPSMLPMDGEGRPLRNALIWMDRRSDDQCDEMNAKIGVEKVFNVTGNASDPFYTYPELLWFKEKEPEKYEKCVCVLQTNGYVNFRLTGELTIDRTHASITQCFDVKRGEWDMDILKAFDVDPSILPKVYPCEQVIGTVTAAASEQTGIPVGTPVLAGAVDGAAAGLEGGVFGSNTAVEMSGTSSVLVAGSDEMCFSPKLTYMYSAIEGQNYLLGCMSTTGGVLKWWRDTIRRESGNAYYDTVNRDIMKNSPDPTKLYILPYLAGERAPIWDTHAKGVIAGITFDTTESDILRGIMEGASYALMDNICEAEAAGVSIKKMRAVGGTTNSDIWMKIKASIIGRPIEVPKQSLGAPGGLLAILAGSLGDYGDTRTACGKMFEIDHIVEPVNAWIEPYRDRFEIFRSLYRNNKETYRAMDEVR